MVLFEETAEYIMGDTSQCLFASLLGRSGHVVVPTYNMTDVTPETKAPVVFCGNLRLIAPDMLVMSRTPEMDVWVDVKAKSVPGWRKFRPGPRWEHGIDYSAAVEYRDIQEHTGRPVWIVVHEQRSPENPLEQSRLVESGKWLCISIDSAFSLGRHEPKWPQRNGNPYDHGRRGEGGLLWWREDMKPAKCTDTMSQTHRK